MKEYLLRFARSRLRLAHSARRRGPEVIRRAIEHMRQAHGESIIRESDGRRRSVPRVQTARQAA